LIASRRRLSAPHGRAVPPRALAISAGALTVAFVGAWLFPEGLVEFGFLEWLLPIIPAFLLCYYRGWTRLMVLLAAAMALLSVGYGVAGFAGINLPEWPVICFVIAAYIAIALGAGWFREVRAAIDERRAAEDELRQAYLDLRASHSDLQLAYWKLIESGRLESVGRLAAGVAHEVKNPLMTLLTGVHYLMQRVPAADGNVRTLLDDMHTAAMRADAVIMGLLDFATPREVALMPEHLNPVVKRAVDLVKHELIAARVTLALALSDGLPRLALDAFKFQQVLVNVLTNAAHATPPGGRITVRTYNRVGHDVLILEVEDSGTGIPEEAMGKLFDPFFTTKPTGKGTGLGLAVARQIVEMHRASITIANRPEGGARVTIAFDVLKESP